VLNGGLIQVEAGLTLGIELIEVTLLTKRFEVAIVQDKYLIGLDSFLLSVYICV
jgi:hypothetical protein